MLLGRCLGFWNEYDITHLIIAIIFCILFNPQTILPMHSLIIHIKPKICAWRDIPWPLHSTWQVYAGLNLSCDSPKFLFEQKLPNPEVYPVCIHHTSKPHPAFVWSNKIGPIRFPIGYEVDPLPTDRDLEQSPVSLLNIKSISHDKMYLPLNKFNSLRI
jgi:hypothetical protein